PSAHEQRDLEEQDQRDDQERPVRAQPIERDHDEPHGREDLEDVAAIDQRVQGADREQQREPPGETPGEVSTPSALVRHDRGEAEAEQQREDGEGLAREERHRDVEPAARLRLEPIEFEALDTVDEKQPEQRITAQAVDHVDAFGWHPSPLSGELNSARMVALSFRRCEQRSDEMAVEGRSWTFHRQLLSPPSPGPSPRLPRRLRPPGESSPPAARS